MTGTKLAHNKAPCLRSVDKVNTYRFKSDESKKLCCESFKSSIERITIWSAFIAKQIINFYSQGGAKFPTGGMSLAKSKDKPASARFVEVSRSGEMPEPTVIVRMRENGNTLV